MFDVRSCIDAANCARLDDWVHSYLSADPWANTGLREGLRRQLIGSARYDCRLTDWNVAAVQSPVWNTPSPWGPGSTRFRISGLGCAIAKVRRRSCAVLDKLPDRDAKLLGLVGKIG
jgi:hypothetical protein